MSLMKMQRVKELLLKPYFVFGLYVFIAIVASLQKALHSIPNNFLIFKYSFLNFINGVDLYSLHPEQHVDYYKYSPSFAVLMAPFSYLPTLMGAVIWNLVNVAVLLYGLRKLDVDDKKTSFVLWLCVFEFLTSLQNFQSNILIAGLMILVLTTMGKERPVLSGLLSSLLFNIKIFGAGVVSLFMLHPRKLRVLISFIASLILIGFILPVLFSSYGYTIDMYASWLRLLAWDLDASYGYSVIAVINQFFPVSKTAVQITGTVLLLLPFMYSWISSRRLDPNTVLASIMIWSVIFNHKAESPTFIIAVVGSAIWYVTSTRTILNRTLIALVFIFTTLSVTEFFPKQLISLLGGIGLVKSVPCILVWIKINYDEWFTLLSSKGRLSYR